jgi:hypothetical protein
MQTQKTNPSPRSDTRMPDTDTLPHSLRLADLLDAKFEMPILGIRFGIDPIIGLVPVLGDTISLVLGLAIVRDAWRLNARKRVIARMLVNLGLDWLVGQVPILGDAADFFIKPNKANAALLQREHDAGRLGSRS